MPVFRRAFLLLLAAALLPANASAQGATAFVYGRHYYAIEDYALAVSELESAVAADPEAAEFHFWLGKAYGRLAESSGWGDAMQLAIKSRDSLRRAVNLAPEDQDALHALIRFYREAPFFLGGSESRADELQIRLDALQRRR